MSHLSLNPKRKERSTPVKRKHTEKKGLCLVILMTGASRGSSPKALTTNCHFPLAYLPNTSAEMHDTSLVQGQPWLYHTLSKHEKSLVCQWSSCLQCQAGAIINQECQQRCAMLLIFFWLCHLESCCAHSLLLSAAQDLTFDLAEPLTMICISVILV